MDTASLRSTGQQTRRPINSGGLVIMTRTRAIAYSEREREFTFTQKRSADQGQAPAKSCSVEAPGGGLWLRGSRKTGFGGSLKKNSFWTHVHVRYMLSPVRLSSVCLSVCLPSVCNARAPYSGGSNFRQYFYGIMYLCHPLTSTENFTEIVPGNPSAGGVKYKRGIQV